MKPWFKYIGIGGLLIPTVAVALSWCSVFSWMKRCQEPLIGTTGDSSWWIHIPSKNLLRLVHDLNVPFQVLFRGDDTGVTTTKAFVEIFSSSTETLFANNNINASSSVLTLDLSVFRNATMTFTTTTNLAVTSLNAASCDVKSAANVGLFCGTDATGGSGGGGYAEFTQVGDNQQNVSTTPFKLANGILASTTAVFDRATITDSLQVGGSLNLQTNFTFDGLTFDSLTDDATLDNVGGDLRVVDVTCTDCLNATEIEDIYLLIAGDSSSGAFTWTGLHTWTDARPAMLNATTTNVGTLLAYGNATTSSRLVVGTTQPINLQFGAGDLFLGDQLYVTGNATTAGQLVIGTTQAAGNIGVGDLFVGGDATTTGSLAIGTAATNDDDALWFDGTSFEGLIWDNSPGEFDLTDDLNITGGATTTANIWIGDATNGVLIDIANNGLKYYGTARPERSIILTSGGATPTIGDSGSSTTTQTTVLYPTNRNSAVHLDFPEGSAASSSAQWLIQLPDNYDGGSLTATLYHTATTTSGNVRWCLDGISYTDSDAIDAAMGGLSCFSSQTVATANDIVVSTTTALTLGGSPTAGETALIRLTRASGGNEDDRANYGRVLQVKLEYTITQEGE